MKLILYTTQDDFKELIKTNIDAVTMFKKHELSINKADKEELIKLINVLIDNDVLFQSCGETLTFIPRHDNYQNVMFKIEG